MTTRRGFLGAMLAAAAAPAFVRSGVLMPVREIIAPARKSVAEMIQEAGLNDALEASFRRATASIAGTPGLMVGDLITIAGVHAAGGALKAFRVSAVSSSGVMTIETH